MQDQLGNQPSRSKRVGLFVTCLVDLMRPNIGFAAIKLLEDAGCEVIIPQSQTCCGQPAYNSGDRKDSREIARQTIAAFEEFDYVVAPSGSCAGMLKLHYPGLFAGDEQALARAETFSAKVHELISFLVDICGVASVAARKSGTVTYHDSCSGLRELKIHDQPRQLLGTVADLTVTELPDADVCCGFGGTFCVKYPEISNKIVTQKTADIAATGADILAAGDLGCLMNMAGKLQREGSTIKAYHVAELLADMADGPAIGGN